MNVFESTLTSKFQITVPKKLRDLLGLREGEKLAFVVDDGVVRVIPRRDPIEALSSLAGGRKMPGLFKKIREDRKQW